MSIYQIRNELFGVLQAIENHGHDSPEAQQALQEHARQLQGALAERAGDVADAVQELEARGAMRCAEGKRISQLGMRDKATAEALKDMLHNAMLACGSPKLDTVRHSLSVVTNGGALKVEVLDEQAVPDEYKPAQIVQKIDLDAIRKAIESGATVPGCKLAPRGTHLRMR